MSTSSRTRIQSLQALRALAALAVLSSHVNFGHFGAWGVSVFFVLSGFVLALSYSNKPLPGGVHDSVFFSVKRIGKLYPLHILTMIAIILVEMITLPPASLVSAVKYIGCIFFDVTLLKSWIPLRSVYFSLNGVSWYLSTSLFLYAAFPVLFKKVKKLDNGAMIKTLVLICIAQLLAGFFFEWVCSAKTFEGIIHWATYISPVYRLGDFACGCILGRLFLESDSRNLSSSFTSTLLELLAIVLTIGSYYVYNNNFGVLGLEGIRNGVLFLPASMYLVYLFAVNKGYISKLLSNKVLIYLGDMSAYSFLIHTVVIKYLNELVFPALAIELSSLQMAIIVFLITAVLGELYKYIHTHFFSNI